MLQPYLHNRLEIPVCLALIRLLGKAETNSSYSNNGTAF
jgi:hypothetical protein